MYVCIYIYIYTDILYVYIYIYTYTHTMELHRRGLSPASLAPVPTFLLERRELYRLANPECFEQHMYSSCF